MAQTLIEVFGPVWIYVVVFILTGIFTSIGVEAINLSLLKSGKNVHPWWLVVLISLIFDLLLIYVFDSLFDNLQEIILMIVVNLFFPILFYNMAGPFTVDLIFKKFRQKAHTVYQLKSDGKLRG